MKDGMKGHKNYVHDLQLKEVITQQSAGLAHSTQVRTHTGVFPPFFYSAEQPNALAEEQKAESGTNLSLPCVPGRLS